jgi:hypothetical protein
VWCGGEANIPPLTSEELHENRIINHLHFWVRNFCLDQQSAFGFVLDA